MGDDLNVTDARPASTTRERTAWLKDWARQRPDSSVHSARAALKAEFGITLGTTSISAILREARAAVGLPAAHRLRPAYAHDAIEQRVNALVNELRTLGVRRLEITEHDFRADIVVTGKM